MDIEPHNKFLVELMGYKYISSSPSIGVIICRVGFEREHVRPWDYFGLLWEWSSKQEWFGTFSKFHTIASDKDNMAILQVYINPERFANELYNFLKDRS